MKNLKNLNLVELNAQEVKEIYGGGIWDEFVAGWNGKEVCPDHSTANKEGNYSGAVVKALSF